MVDDMKWLVGFVVALVGLIGGIVARDRQVSKAIKDGDDDLHSRINKTRDEYVKRNDLDAHLSHIEAGQKQLREDLRHHNSETTRRLDALMASVSVPSNNSA